MSLFLPLPSFPLSVTLSHSLSFQGEGMWVVRVIWFQTADIYLETAAVFPLLRVFKYLHIPLTLTCYSWTRPLLPCPGLSSVQVHYTLSYRISHFETKRPTCKLYRPCVHCPPKNKNWCCSILLWPYWLQLWNKTITIECESVPSAGTETNYSRTFIWVFTGLFSYWWHGHHQLPISLKKSVSYPQKVLWGW